MCTDPLKGFKYGHTDKGKDKYYIRPYRVDHLEFDDQGHPHNVYDEVAVNPQYDVVREYIDIPCGKCIECRLDYARVWSNRCFLESLEHEDNCFITLTYNDNFIPVRDSVDPVSGELVKYNTLVKKDFQDFMKRLRKRIDKPIRFFACGEYSPAGRPHYHAIIFGWKPKDEKDISVVGKNKLGQYIYESKLLEQVWQYGFNTFGECTPQSCNYVARYVTKKVNAPMDKLHDKMGIEREFVLMSRRPGIGQAWFNTHKDCYANFLCNYESTDTDSIRISHNRFFDNKLEKEDPLKMQVIKDIRKESAKRRKRLEQSTTSLPYYENLKSKEEHLKAKTKILTIRKEI